MSQKNKILRGGESFALNNVNACLDVRKAGYLKKLKKMKKRYFVLRKTSDVGPARLEYHSSEKKWRTGNEPRRSIVLKSCFNISRKLHSKNKCVIALYTQDDCFAVVTESEEELDQWLSAMLELQHEDMEMDGDSKSKPVFDHVWQVIVDDKELDCSQDINGPYRLGLTSNTLSLVKMNSASEKLDILEFPLMSIRRCGHSGRHFFIEVGRSAVTGAGGIWMETEATIIAQNMHETILGAMKSSRNREELGPLSRPRSASTSENSKPIATRRPLGLNIPQSLSTMNTSISNSRERCDSLPSRPRNSNENPPESSHSPMSAQPTPSTKLYHKENSRPHSVYAWPSVNSPICNNLSFSPGSLSASFCSTGSNVSSDESENFQQLYLSRYSYALCGDGILSADEPITEVPDEYLMMSPTSDGKSIVPEKSDYLIMDPSAKNTDVVRPDEEISPSPVLSVKNIGNSATVDYMDMASPTSSNQESYIPMSVIGSLNVESSFVKQRNGSACEEKSSLQQNVNKSNGYIVMAPGGAANDTPVTLQEGYLDMMPLSSSLPSEFHGFHTFDSKDFSGNSKSVQNSKENSILSENKDTFVLDKVPSFVKQSDCNSHDYIKPARTYSVGNRPQVCESRTRAYSVGSQTTKPKRQTSIHPHLTDARNIDSFSKSCSAPVLQNSLSKNFASSSKGDFENDLMEIDYNKPIGNNSSSSVGQKSSEFVSDKAFHSTRHRTSSKSSSTAPPMMLLNEINENFIEQTKDSPCKGLKDILHNFEVSSEVTEISGEDNINAEDRKNVDKDLGNVCISMSIANDLNAASQEHVSVGLNDEKVMNSQSKENFIPNIINESVAPSLQYSAIKCDNLNDTRFPLPTPHFPISDMDQNANLSNIFEADKAKPNSFLAHHPSIGEKELHSFSMSSDKSKLLNVVKELPCGKPEPDCLQDCERKLTENLLTLTDDAKYFTPKIKSEIISPASASHKRQSNTKGLMLDIDNSHGDYVSLDLGKTCKYTSPTAKYSPIVCMNVNQAILDDSDSISESSENHEYMNVWLGKPRGISSDSSCNSDCVSSPLHDSMNRNISLVSNSITASEAAAIQEENTHTVSYLPSSNNGCPCSPFGKSPVAASKPSRSHQSLPAFRKQMSAPAAPSSLRPELPSPGRKSSCPVTASASMVRSSVVSPAASSKMVSLSPLGGMSGLLKVSSKSPDHSSVSSISSISDEISSNHSSPKMYNVSGLNLDRKIITETQYENVSILPRSASSSRPSSVSSEKELNYASLDLAPSSSDEAPRSPRVIKVPQPETFCDGPPLSYAEIDFTKSEGLRHTSGTLREGRL